ncbi:MAG TPA: T9SS type A sorting domain-containing protein [Chitinophagales bacterium]|nr:T9SS type A sorting domain-containing protein [Chitinophagales bacterium]HRP38391.1 T9SS type A sorting domain-containing protein [Chitinophagales bacterium]
MKWFGSLLIALAFHQNTYSQSCNTTIPGTLSTSGSEIICTPGQTGMMVVSNYQGDIQRWERKLNGGSWVTVYSLPSNIFTDYDISSQGTYTYRVAVQCSTDAVKFTNEITFMAGGLASKAACSSTYGDLRYAVAKVHVPGVSNDFSGFLINNTNNDGRLLFITTSQFLTNGCSNPSYSIANATFTWNEDYASCSSGTLTPVTSNGATILAIDGRVALLELANAPDLAELTYLGWDIATPYTDISCIYPTYDPTIKKGIVSASAYTSPGLGIECNDNYFESLGLPPVVKIAKWNSGEPNLLGRGSPLIMSNKKAAGIYLTGNETHCSNGPSYFEDFQSIKNGSVFNYLRTGNQTNTATVRMNYCKPSENLGGLFNQSFTYSVSGSGYITSTQNISDGNTVKYQAGTYIELNPGFISGTDFVAEINPCVSIVTTIAAKTDDEQTYHQEDYATVNITTDDWIKVYPTILPAGNSLTIEANDVIDDVELFMFDLQGKHICLFRLNGFLRGNSVSVPLDVAKGMYVLKARHNNHSFTQKIIIQ